MAAKRPSCPKKNESELKSSDMTVFLEDGYFLADSFARRLPFILISVSITLTSRERKAMYAFAVSIAARRVDSMVLPVSASMHCFWSASNMLKRERETWLSRKMGH